MQEQQHSFDLLESTLDKSKVEYLYLGSIVPILIDKEDFDKVKNYKWFIEWKWKSVKAKVGKHRRSRIIALARFILTLENVEFDVDHINRITFDNRKSNLRKCLPYQNAANRHKRNDNSRSKYKGISFRTDNKKWRAWITINGKRHNLGQFDTEIEAAKAYNEGAIKYHGEFACINSFE